MKDYRVTLSCPSCGTREVYAIEAEDANWARDNWFEGRVLVQEVDGLDVDSVHEVGP